MIIAVNTRLLIPGKMEGIGRFACETLSIITRAHPEHRFVFLFDRKYSDEFIFSSNIIPVTCFPPARHPLLWYWFFEQSLPGVLNKHKADLFFSPDGWLSLRTEIKSVPVIHDLNFNHFPEFIPFHVRTYYQYYFPRFVKKAARIATVSEFTRNDLCNWYAVDRNNIDVVYNGARGFTPADESTQKHIRDKYTGGAPYFLFVGLIHPRKNLTNLMLAFDMFRREVPGNVKLLITGARKWWTDDMQVAFDKCIYKDDIVFAGRVQDSELKLITASALSLVYVSYFEGFGIPVLESMYADTPVICSFTTSLPEVAGDAALYVDPSNVESIKSAMVKMAMDPVFRQHLIEKARIQRNKFTWEKTADILWKCIEKCL